MLEKIAEKIKSEVFVMYDIACSLTSYLKVNCIVEIYAFDSLYLSLFVETWSSRHFGCYNHMSPNISLLWP